MISRLVTLAGRSLKLAPRNRLLAGGAATLRALGLRHLVVRMDTSWQCNLRCPMCHFSSADAPRLPAMDPELYERIAADLFPRALYLALSCGAEPYMTRDFGRYLRVAARYRVPWTVVVTNGLLLDEAKVEDLVDCRLSELVVSADGATAGTYERIRVNGRFERLLEVLALVRDVKTRRRSRLPRLRMNFVVMRENVHELADFVDVVAPFGPDAIQVRHVGVNEGMRWAFDELTLRRDEASFDRALEEAHARARRRGIRWDAPEPFGRARARRPREARTQSPACVNPWIMVYVHPDGSFRPCTYHELTTFPNLATSSHDEVVAALGSCKRKLREDPDASCLRLCRDQRGRTHSVTTDGLVTVELPARTPPS